MEKRKRNEYTDNYNFVQIRKGYMKQLRLLTKKSPVARQLLDLFVENMGRLDNAVVCSHVTMTELLGYSRPSISKALKVLKEDNWIGTVKVGNTTVYCVNEQVFWQAAKNQRHYARFSACVVASETEQESKLPQLLKQQKLHRIPILTTDEYPYVVEERLPPPDQIELEA